ncbi:MAG TPA: cysteine desulfurase family protein [Rhizomicrobium sp.]|jgi:cysteine desulfurase|nr:cysteine desulfurase family protein [Rhizomicrobium sp.]
MHFCDHNATSPLRPSCRDAVLHALTIGGNPSSVHAAGRAAHAIVEEAREAVAKLVSANADEVIFTSGATESNSLALWGAVEGAMTEGDKPVRITRLFVSAIEHSSVLKTAQRVAERSAGLRLEILPVTKDGVLDTEALRVALREGKGRALVVVMAANNETGVVQPIAEISRLAREAHALLLVDAVTAAGKIDLDFALCDYMTLSAHKLGGPQGSGALVVRQSQDQRAPFAPQLAGGGQQKGLRAGTENLSGIAGFGAAAKAVMDDGEERARIAALRDGFEKNLKTAISGVTIFGENAPRLCSTSNVALPGLSGENIVIALDLDGVLVSSGSSCSSGKITPSHVLSAMGVGEALAGASLRVSFGWNSTKEDADAVVASLVRLNRRALQRAAE